VRKEGLGATEIARKLGDRPGECLSGLDAIGISQHSPLSLQASQVPQCSGPWRLVGAPLTHVNTQIGRAWH